MCLILTAKEYVPHIAEEDIPCFKHSYKRKGSDFLIGPFTYYVYLNVKYHKSVTLTAKINPILHENNPCFTLPYGFPYGCANAFNGGTPWA